MSWASALISTLGVAVGLAEPLFALLDSMLSGQILEMRWLVRQHRLGESIATRMPLVARRLAMTLSLPGCVWECDDDSLSLLLVKTVFLRDASRRWQTSNKESHRSLPFKEQCIQSNA